MVGLCLRAARLLRRQELGELLRAFFDRVPAGVFHFDILQITEAGTTAPRMRRRMDLDLRPVERKDLNRLQRVFPRSPASEYEDRLVAGHIGIVAEFEGHLCGMSWLDLNTEHVEREKFCTFVLPPDGAWHYDLAIPTEWQLAGVLPSLLASVSETVSARGRSRIFGYVSWHNRASREAMERFGYVPIRRITVLSLLGLRIQRTRRLGDEARARTLIGFGSGARIRLGLLSTSDHPQQEQEL